MRRILIIDDDLENLSVLSDMLIGSFEPLTASSGRDGIRKAVSEQPDVVLLDVNMPEMDGFEVCKRLKEQPSTRQIPIIMLTTAANLESRVKGLDIGADDYVTKPFQVKELIARVNARIRRFDGDRKQAGEMTIGNLRLDTKSCQIWIDSNSVRLTQMEFQLIRYFLERPNQVIPRNKLLGDLWPDAVVTDRTVDTHVANLRKKIGNFTYALTTIYGAGYILKVPE